VITKVDENNKKIATLTISFPATEDNPRLDTIASVSISGTPSKGQNLTAKVEGLDGKDVIKYQWSTSTEASGPFTDISDAKAKENFYTLAETDVDKYIMVTVSSAAEYSGTVSSNPRKVVEAFPVTALSLGSLFSAPVKGAKPDVTLINVMPINESQYTGTIAWSETIPKPVVEGSKPWTQAEFDTDTKYTAVVTLKAKDGYTFDGLSENSFSYTGALTVTNSAGSGTVTITFPATAPAGTDKEPIATTVNALTLDKLVVAPVKGGKTTATLTGSQYTGTITWQTTADDKLFTGDFAAGTRYTAVITLTATANYTFPSVGDGKFSHTGAETITTSVNNNTDPVKVTVIITFPATEAAKPSDIAITIGYKQGITITEGNGADCSDGFTISKTGVEMASGTQKPRTATLSPASGYSGVLWYVDGEKITKNSPGRKALLALIVMLLSLLFNVIPSIDVRK
jgi:hypothetical protein